MARVRQVGSQGTSSEGPLGAVAPGKRSATDQLVQRKAAGPSPGEAVAEAASSSGAAPDAAVRASVERVTGADLAGARVHTGAASAQAADAVGARAYTIGQDIHFGLGEYKPGSSDGDRLLAHELGHAAQQGPGGNALQGKLAVSQEHDSSEVEADAIADAAMGGGAAVEVRHRGGVQLAREKVAGNRFGDWDITQINTDGVSATARYSSAVDIAFAPDRTTVDASEIAFVQTLRTVNVTTSNPTPESATYEGRRTDDGFMLDRVPDRKMGFYGYNNDGNPSTTVTPGSSPDPLVTAKMRDVPGWNKPSTKWEFESAVVAKAGNDVGAVYGALTWGFDVDDQNKLTSHAPVHLDKTSGSFDNSVKKWNEQAAGEESKRNHKDQEQLGPFSSKSVKRERDSEEESNDNSNNDSNLKDEESNENSNENSNKDLKDKSSDEPTNKVVRTEKKKDVKKDKDVTPTTTNVTNNTNDERGGNG